MVDGSVCLNLSSPLVKTRLCADFFASLCTSPFTRARFGIWSSRKQTAYPKKKDYLESGDRVHRSRNVSGTRHSKPLTMVGKRTAKKCVPAAATGCTFAHTGAHIGNSALAR